MEKYHGNTVEYWKQNAEENYLTTPISVLKYITVLEEQAEQLRKHAVSGALPVDSAIKEIENLMERWHLARDNDGETLQGINDVLVSIGLLGWFNRK